MRRSELTRLPAYFDRYIDLCDDVELPAAIATSITELENFAWGKCKALADRVYAPGKWTVKDILQHLIDTERIFTYRALAFARKETKQMPSYEEDQYAAAANANSRTLEDLVDELKLLHRSTKAMFASFSDETLAREGQGFKGPYSVASIGFILPGHQRWHLRILEERYFPLL